MDLISIRIMDSYNTWLPTTMRSSMIAAAMEKYQVYNYNALLGRDDWSLFLEWWIHNIGYYLTLPFCSNERVAAINLRFKHVDLERLD